MSEPFRKPRPKKLRAPQDVVTALWERMARGDWAGARETLSDELVVMLPGTLERFEGPDAYLDMFRSFPTGWQVSVKSVHANNNEVLAWVEVPFEGRSTWCVQRLIVSQRTIFESIDLWTDEGDAAEATTWRTPNRTAPIADPAPALNEEAL